MNMLRYVAFFTMAGGMLVLARVAGAVAAEIADGFRLPLFTLAILASALGAALAIVWVAVLYLQQRNRRSALRLAAAASAVACLAWPASGGHAGGGVVAALLFYLVVARPAVGAAFPGDEGRQPDGVGG